MMRPQAESSVYTMSIGDRRRQRLLRVPPGTIMDTRRRRPLTMSQLVDTLEPSLFILVGEQHDNANHHQFQASVIEALTLTGRAVIVGMEMFDRTVQYPLNLWTLNRLSEAEFIEQSQWKQQWGFDYALYRPIFEVVRRYRLRLVALNVPRALVRQVGRNGWQSVPPEDRLGIPDLELSNSEHRALFTTLMSGHPPTGAQGENIYSAQVLWDTAMADSAIRYLQRTVPSDRLAFVILAGNGHVMYDVGISLRLRQRGYTQTATLVCLPDSQQPIVVRAALADFIYLPASAADRTL
ncbi:MAG: hypothetical protein C4336_09210 [Armatimonadota bacterium]